MTKAIRIEVTLIGEHDEVKTSLDVGEVAQEDKERLGLAASHLAQFAFLTLQHTAEED